MSCVLNIVVSYYGIMEKIEQRHREKAAQALEARYPQDPKTPIVAAKLRAGQADDNAAVQAAAFYEANPT